MEGQTLKVGIVSCSGEDLCEGTISRLAARKVLEELRPGRTVTICLPLFLAGGEGERAFARTYPTITVDGCGKACAKCGTEMHSGPVGAALVVSDILGQTGQRVSGEVSARRLTDDDLAAIDLIAGRIAEEVDRLGRPAIVDLAEDEQAGCECAKPLPGGELVVDGRRVEVTALPLIFERMAAAGLPADDACGPRLLAVTKVYHPIVAAEEGLFTAALAAAYGAYLADRAKAD
ncbi:MAG: putative zinc-binding protein [Dehalococcoidales bacterium]|nr:putative zinc-binding protein [Dehalococcoidales bacterium]